MSAAEQARPGLPQLLLENPWAVVSEHQGSLFCICKCCSAVADEEQGSKNKPSFGKAPGIKLKDDQTGYTRQLRSHARKLAHKKAAEAYEPRAASAAAEAAPEAELGASNAADEHLEPADVQAKPAQVHKACLST